MSHATVLVVLNDVPENLLDSESLLEDLIEAEMKPYDEKVRVEPYLQYSPDDAVKEMPQSLVVDHGGNVTEALKAWFGEGNVRDDGSIWSTYNPESKWDWWVIGGRWPSMILTKDGKRTSIARKNEIDFEKMKADRLDAAHEEYDEFEEAAKGLDISPTWKAILESYGGDAQSARVEWDTYPWVKAVRAVTPFLEDPHEYFKVNEGGRDAYVEQRAFALTTHAFLLDGEWMENGQLGWFGAVSGEGDVTDWNKRVEGYLEGLPDDALLVVVDYHI